MELPLLGALLILGAAAFPAAILFCRRIADRARSRSLVFLQVLMPKKESKEDKERMSEEFSSGKTFKDVVGVMDHLFQSFYGMYEYRKLHRFIAGQPFFSVEFAALEGEILFYVVIPRSLLSFTEKQITSFYPDAVIDEVEDYNIFTEESFTASTYLVPSRALHLPLKTYETMKSDQLNAITNAFSKLKSNEGAAIQI